MAQQLISFIKYKTEEEMDAALAYNMRQIPVPGIDMDLSKSNITLIPFPQNLTKASDFFTKRIKDNNVANKTRISILAAELVFRHTIDNLPEGYEEESFIKETFDFIVKEFGKENIMHFVVHKDEGNPHIHVIFVPVKGNRLVYSEFINGDKGQIELEKKYYDKHLYRIGFRASFDFGVPSSALVSKKCYDDYIKGDDTCPSNDNVKSLNSFLSEIKKEKVEKVKAQRERNKALTERESMREELFKMTNEVNSLKEEIRRLQEEVKEGRFEDAPSRKSAAKERFVFHAKRYLGSFTPIGLAQEEKIRIPNGTDSTLLERKNVSKIYHCL